VSSTIKTAISIKKTLFDQADALARKLNISRSSLFGMALENFIQKYQNQILLDEINQAYSDQPEAAEQELLAKMRRKQRKILENEW
jgi:metal-responsive CopG/Arc/MetJ family transcriptional regulator